MKHKITAVDICEFNMIFDEFLKRCKQTNEEVARAKFTFDTRAYHGYRAKVWTKPANTQLPPFQRGPITFTDREGK